MVTTNSSLMFNTDDISTRTSRNLPLVIIHYGLICCYNIKRFSIQRMRSYLTQSGPPLHVITFHTWASWFLIGSTR